MPTKPRHWLVKSEPDVYSIDDLARDGRSGWEGVRSYEARNNLRAMAEGDLLLFYHSNADPPGVAGVARVARTAYPDPHQFDAKSEYFDPASKKEDPRWSTIDVEFVEKFAAPVPLDALKADKVLSKMAVAQKGTRLSVTPVEPAHFKRVVAMGARA